MRQFFTWNNCWRQQATAAVTSIYLQNKPSDLFFRNTIVSSASSQSSLLAPCSLFIVSVSKHSLAFRSDQHKYSTSSLLNILYKPFLDTCLQRNSLTYHSYCHMKGGCQGKSMSWTASLQQHVVLVSVQCKLVSCNDAAPATKLQHRQLRMRTISSWWWGWVGVASMRQQIQQLTLLTQLLVLRKPNLICFQNTAPHLYLSCEIWDEIWHYTMH